MTTPWGYLINNTTEERIIELQYENVVITYQGCHLFQIDYNNSRKQLEVLSYPCWLNGLQVNQKINFENGAQITTKLGMAKIVYIYLDRSARGNALLRQVDLDEEYVFGRKIGEGAFGSVYTLFEKASGFKSALKIQNLKAGDVKPNREAQVLPQLDHPCLIWTQDIRFKNSMMFIKMEYMQGGDLQTFVNNSGPHLSVQQTKVIFYQIVEAVDYLHSKGICHRDLKPANILLQNPRPDTLIKVSDFGLAKSEIIHSPMTSWCGTMKFMAPEVCNMDVTDYDKTIDVWSMGVILHLSLSGKFPEFKMNTSFLLCPAILSNEKNNSMFCLLQGMLQKDPKNRFNVTEVREQEWLKDKCVEEKVLELVASDTSSKFRKQKTPRRMTTPVTQAQKLDNASNAAPALVAGVGIAVILGAGALLLSELFKPNNNRNN